MADTYKVIAAAALVVPTSGNAALVYRNGPVPADSVNLEALLASGTVGKVEDGDYAGGHPSDLPLDYAPEVEVPEPKKAATAPARKTAAKSE